MAVGGRSFGYNARGDQVSRVVGAQSTSVQWDHQGRMLQLSGAENASYRYDAGGRRAVVTSGGVTRWVVGEAFEVSSDGSERVSYRLGGETVAPVVSS